MDGRFLGPPHNFYSKEEAAEDAAEELSYCLRFGAPEAVVDRGTRVAPLATEASKYPVPDRLEDVLESGLILGFTCLPEGSSGYLPKLVSSE